MNRSTGLGLAVLLLLSSPVVDGRPPLRFLLTASSADAAGAAASAAPAQVALWPGGAQASRAGKTNRNSRRTTGFATSIIRRSPSIFPPREKATGTGVVIFPGGGHRLLVFKAEGDEPARFLNGLGVAAFVLRYRLGREENSPYRLEQHPREDAYRALRTVRSRAREWGWIRNGLA